MPNELQNRTHLLHRTYLNSTTSQEHCPERIEMDDIVRDNIPEELYRVASEVFDHMPTKFLDGFRSPCWRVKSKLTCLPSFMLTGVGKCGTTDVWDKIVAHPDIVVTGKEPRWWSRFRVGRDRGLYNPFPLSWYANQYNKLGKAISEARDSNKAKKLIAGDGSPSNYWDNVVWKTTLTAACQNLTTPRYVVADVIRTVLPKIKILAVFRNPTSRLYSDYNFDNRSCTPEFFHDSVTESTRTFDSCLATSTRKECVFKFFSEIYEADMARKPRPKGKLGMNPIMRLFKGSYSVFVTDWLRAFPRDQVFFIKMEDWHSECKTMLPNIYQFLDLEPIPKQKTDEICNKKQKNKTPGTKAKGSMLPETKQLLDKFYEPIRKDLAQILDDDRFLWNN
ncbi:carbohydrate sulfotransferase 15-like [Amphiura filiformis]|uniref:carbohydrate sulfotransferase 15-like n=1 Tax=Amphiura filiformis TaxID=82378 RepID=UPI003B2145D4